MFSFSERPGKVDIYLTSELENIDLAGNVAQRFVSREGMLKEWFSVLLVFREALTNAVVHGSARDPEKKIRCGLAVKGDSLWITVEDQGPGFDWRVRLGREKPNPAAVKGRGLAVMKEYFDEIFYNERGNKIVLVKRIRPEIRRGYG